MRLLLKVIVLTMITFFPFSTNAGTYLDLHKALSFKQHGQYGKAFPILLQLSENGLVRAQMELADMYVKGHGIRKIMMKLSIGLVRLLKVESTEH